MKLLIATILVTATVALTPPASAHPTPHGTAQDDRLTGTSGPDYLEGRGGADVVLGLAGDDRLAGNRGADRLVGGAGNDVVYGGPRADVLRGGAGDDALIGGPGRDLLSGSRGADYLEDLVGGDVLRGGPGDDDGVIDERTRRETRPTQVDLGRGADTFLVHPDAGPDTIDCGPGRDVASWIIARDPLDTYVDCEVVEEYQGV